MASGANLDVNILSERRACGKLVAATTQDLDGGVFGVDSFFHGTLSGPRSGHVKKQLTMKVARSDPALLLSFGEGGDGQNGHGVRDLHFQGWHGWQNR
jgi:hypothetical protein